MVLLLQPGEKKMTHVTKSTPGTNNTVETSPAGDVRGISEEHEVNTFGKLC